jgi:hypothetical protein
MLVDPPPDLELKGIVVAELEAWSRGDGSNVRAGRARSDLLLVGHGSITS